MAIKSADWEDHIPCGAPLIFLFERELVAVLIEIESIRIKYGFLSDRIGISRLVLSSLSHPDSQSSYAFYSHTFTTIFQLCRILSDI